jgi:HK97 family phage major capsid protein
MNRIVTRPSQGKASSVVDASREVTQHLQRTTLALMRSQYALQRLEAKTEEAEEFAAAPRRHRAPAARTLEDRKRRAAELVGSFDGDIVTAFGEFAATVVRSINGREDPRLVRAPTGASEGAPTDGGMLVPEQFLSIKSALYDTSEIATFADIRETANPLAAVKIPGIDETSRQDGSRWGGFASYWDQEAGSVATSFPRSKMLEFTGKKMHITTRVTTELLNDYPMLGVYLLTGFAAEGSFKLDTAMISGTGAGQPLGFLNSKSLISVPKQSGQAPATIVKENVDGMWARLPAPCRQRAMWLINEDAEPQLQALNGAVGTGGALLYRPPGAVSAFGENATLYGRPLKVIEQNPALGTAGDISVIDPTQYIIIDGGAKSLMSLHARFDNDEVVFRFTWRVDGLPAYSSPITPYSGSSTRSPFVCVAAR